MQISSNKSSSCCAPALSFLLSLSLWAAPASLARSPSGMGAQAPQQHPVTVLGPKSWACCPAKLERDWTPVAAPRRTGLPALHLPPAPAPDPAQGAAPGCERAAGTQPLCLWHFHHPTDLFGEPVRRWPACALHHTAMLRGAGLRRCERSREPSWSLGWFSWCWECPARAGGQPAAAGPWSWPPASPSWGCPRTRRLVLLTITFSQHLGSCRLPCCAWLCARGGYVEPSVPTLRTFSVLLPFTSICIMCAILSHLHIPWDSLELITERLPWANSTVHSPWLRIPYPGEEGWPLLTPRALAVGIAMAIGSSINSVGCYVLCGRLLRAPRLPPHACNRGLCTEALGSLLAGLLGAAGGTASSIANACASSLTQAGSRLSVQVSALVCVALGMSPRLAGLLTRIPLVVHGGVLCVTYAVAVGTGISYFQYADIDSGRNIFIVGFTMFMALLVPRWLSTAPVHLATGWVPLDLLLLSLLMVPVFLTGFLSFFLENTVSGTLEERGLLVDLAARRGDRCPRGERGDTSHVYRLPTRLRRLLPLSRCKAFPCCFLCPGHDEEEEQGSRATEEGTAATGEGTHLLLKASTVEMQLERRLSETETLVWHAAA
ncbi:solute carrier family 23 member 3 isoform X4 [Apteryx mantelli]|uniref:Solute carrier family 23 member 3 isoform X4 n=1 Tax=Apteryx mantelli TaxID=2696672 RepID=A0ABM4ERE9_9AVES